MNIRTITIFPQSNPPIAYEHIHGGTWFARYKQAGGEISKDEADRLVRQARIERARNRAQRRG